jgi:hypothetical protein
VLKLVAGKKLEVLEGGEKLKGVLLILAEALHVLVLTKVQVSEGGRQETADGHSKESPHVMRTEILQFG